MSYIPSIWIWLGIIACITLSALFAGLNLAIFSLSKLRLQIEADGGNKDAARVLDLRKNSNQVLATVIWGNVGTNVFLTLLSGFGYSSETGRLRFASDCVVGPGGLEPPTRPL